MKKAILILSALLSCFPLNARTGPKRRAKAHAAPAKSFDADKNLADFSAQPFSDQGSHITVLRKNGEGFASYDLISAMAFGSLAARPNPAKKLFNLRLELEVAGQSEGYFAHDCSPTAEDFPRWSMQKAIDRGVTGEATLLYPEEDALILAANFTNRSKAAIRIRPHLVFSGGGEDVDSQAKLDSKAGVLTLSLDRSRLVQRKYKESICVLAGGPKSSGIFSAASMKGAENLSDSPLVGLGGFTVSLAPAAYTTLKPGQALRFPVAISVALDEKSARLPMARLWSRWAVTKGEALGKAKARWSLSSARLPHAVDPKFERLGRKAALTLLMSEYARRSELKSDMFSQAKGFRDAFFSDGLPMIALGYSELDLGLAEAALLELGSFSAAAPAPVPPHTGEELLLWETAGLPMHGFAAWELYQRDPELMRAGDFLKATGIHLRNECAWWPPHRDGDGNGLYAFAADEEKPWVPGATDSYNNQILQTYSISLSSMVSWQMQAAGALATAMGEKAEGDKLAAESLRISKALKAKTRDAAGIYEQGLDGLLPYILGLDQDLPQARTAMGLLTRSAAADALPFAEDGHFQPSQAYMMLRGLCLYGEHELARKAASKILEFLAEKPVFSAYALDGKGLGAPGDAASAAAILEMALERQEQEAFLLPDTKALSGRMIQIRTPDGALYIKRLGLGENKAPYETLNLGSLAGGAILAEGAFSLESDKDVRMSVASQWNLDISEEKTKREMFKGTKRTEFAMKAKTRYIVRIIKS